MIFLALLAAGCGGMRSGVKGAEHELCAPPAARGADLALAAKAIQPLHAFRTPGHEAIARFGLENVNGVDTVFAVRGQTCDGSWLHVELPLRPNGATGWVRASRVHQYPVRARIVVDVSARTVRFFRSGKLVLQSAAAVGSPATPTPLGRYYVNQRLIPSDTSGPFGPGAIGISAFSPVLTGWAQGGPVAIHGTNEPWSIGHAVSNGCIRVPNTVLKRMFGRTPSGTPVIIEP